MAKTPPVRKHLRPAEREKILQAYRRSQLTQRDFAAHVGIGLSTLHAWLRKAAGSSTRPATAFIEVPNLLAQGPRVPMYRLHLSDGVEVEVSAGFRPEELASLLQLLRG